MLCETLLPEFLDKGDLLQETGRHNYQVPKLYYSNVTLPLTCVYA